MRLLILALAATLLSCSNPNPDTVHETTVQANLASVESLWKDFHQKHPTTTEAATPLSFYFCDNKKDADECADLVIQGVKQATATSLWWFEKNNEALPKVGDQYVVTDWDGQAKAVIETTKVEQVPYNQVTAEFAATEGEGDKSLAYWKKVHKAYYSREMEPAGDAFSEDMIIVCEYFKVIHVK